MKAEPSGQSLLSECSEEPAMVISDSLKRTFYPFIVTWNIRVPVLLYVIAAGNTPPPSFYSVLVSLCVFTVTALQLSGVLARGYTDRHTRAGGGAFFMGRGIREDEAWGMIGIQYAAPCCCLS